MITVYRFGLLPPTAGADIVAQQLRLAHNYRNTLTEIERGRRHAIRTSLLDHDGIATLTRTVSEADAECLRISREIKAIRSKTQRKVESDDLRVALTNARQTKRDAIRELSALRRELSPPIRQQIDARALELSKSAREHQAPYWGTYLLVEKAAYDSRTSTPLYDGDQPNDPRFARWTGEGSLGVQLQNGLPVPRALSCFDSRLRFQLRPARNDGSRRGRTQFGELHMRIESAGRAPVWGVWPIRVDCPMPEDGIIKWCTVNKRKIGPRDEWFACLTVETNTPRGAPPPKTGTIAIDVGWRLIGVGDQRELRVATWVDDKGQHGELRLSARELSGLTFSDGIRSHRDKNFDAARGGLAWWLCGAVEARVELPAWLTDATRTLLDWKSPARLAGLARRWRENRFTGDEDVYGLLEAWRYRDFHLWAYEANQRQGAIRARRDKYRCFAKWLTTHYERVVLERFDLRDYAQKGALGSPAEKERYAQSRVYLRLAAIGELRECITKAFTCTFRKTGVEANGPYGLATDGRPRVALVDPYMSTRTCSHCGTVNEWNAARSITNACVRCDAVWDQDENAALNHLARWETERTDAPPGSAPAKDRTAARGGRFARAKQRKAEDASGTAGP